MTTSRVKRPEMVIVGMLAALSRHFKRYYCYPSQNKITELLRTKYGVSMSRRTVNRHLGTLEDQGYIKRVRRHKKGPTGALECHSTLYVLVKKGIKFAWTLAMDVKKSHINHRVPHSAHNTCQKQRIMEAAGSNEPCPPPPDIERALRELLSGAKRPRLT